MSMASATRGSGLTLAFLGLVGIGFFWVTDPHFGPARHGLAHAHGRWQHWLFILCGSPDNAMDAANQALAGTVVGVAGSLCVLLIGLWLLTRRKA